MRDQRWGAAILAILGVAVHGVAPRATGHQGPCDPGVRRGVIAAFRHRRRRISVVDSLCR